MQHLFGLISQLFFFSFLTLVLDFFLSLKAASRKRYFADFSMTAEKPEKQNSSLQLCFQANNRSIFNSRFSHHKNFFITILAFFRSFRPLIIFSEENTWFQIFLSPRQP